MSEANATFERILPVTPEDDKKLPASNAISCNASGIVAMRIRGGDVITKYLLAGVDYPYAVTEVLEAGSGTTATGIHLSYYA